MKKQELFHKLFGRFRKNFLFSKIMSRTGKDVKDHKWIFIVGCYNSGTTLLDQILAAHPEISGLPDEGVILTDQLVTPEDFNWRRMWWKCRDQIQNSEVDLKKDARIIKRHWSHFYDFKKSFFVEKSISNVLRIPFLNSNFKPAYFIHIIRNGYAVAEGIKRKAVIMEDNPLYGTENYPIEMCAEQWVQSLKLIEDTKTELDHFLEIKYEDLSEDPNKVVNQIMDFLQLEKMNHDIADSEFQIHEKNSKIKNMNSNSIKKLTKAEVDNINTVAGEYLEKYDYEILRP